jgi:SAM-dependent methyltransferase
MKKSIITTDYSSLPQEEVNAIVSRYNKRYEIYGYDPRSLGWDKGKQDLRFDVLTGFHDCRGKSILDIGCGFGDLNKFLVNKYQNDYEYLGIDLVTEFVEEGKKNYEGSNINFLVGDFLSTRFDRNFDLIFSSGIFNHKMKNFDNYKFINKVMKKAFLLCNEGFAFDFLSDQVEYKYENTFHSNPSKVLNMAYELTRRVSLRNDYFPFEFSISVYKKDTFSTDSTVFTNWKGKKPI